MPPHEGLTHLKEYDIKDSNVELIGTEIDHKVKYNSAATEPAWNNGTVGQVAGLYIWRIEDFEVVVWPKAKAGQFYDGDSYIVLHSFKVGEKEGKEQLIHDIFFWLGSKTSQDEAGTAAYKTVELDKFLKGVATQHREIQQSPSDEFMALFPRIKILSGGVRSGFRHVDQDVEPKEISTLLRIFKHPGKGRADSMVVIEVDPTWQSLNDEDVFVLDKGDKIWVWQGKKCSPMEKAKAAQVVNDLTLAKHIDVEVLAQTDSRSRLVVDLLGGRDADQTSFHAPRPVSSSRATAGSTRPRKLFRLSDSSGELSFDLVKDGAPIQRADLDGNDVFLVDIGSAIWVWRGLGASKAEKAMWLNVAQSYIRQLQGGAENENAHLIPLASVVESHESPAFFKAIEV
ncbi:putative actin-binding protein Fragmin [Stipitochalara longipes BDJ]|nr:putative actin-binding protein Fragmin [Stipitochalara longipes BDJ]